MSNKIEIINTGGTFNKQYNPITGTLDVVQDNRFVEEICQKVFMKNNKIQIKGILYKDSLEIDDNDRKRLYEVLEKSSCNKIIIIHGTDTMDRSASYLEQYKLEKQIVFIGAMEPYSINEVESVGNLMQAYGFLLGNDTNGIYISMHGIVSAHEKIIKNREIGVFECQS